MHRLDDIFKISQRILSKEMPHTLPDGESPIFNASWLLFLTMTPHSASVYSKLWQAGLAMMLGNKIEPMSVKSVTNYSRLICHSYIACGLNCAENLRDAPLDDTKQLFSETIAQKLMFITALALTVNTRRIPYAADRTLPDNLRAALTEFYSLARLTLTELKANTDTAFHEGVNLTLQDIGYITATLGLPRLLSADAREAELAAPSGVAIMPKRPGIALAAPCRAADVVDFRAALRRNISQNVR